MSGYCDWKEHNQHSWVVYPVCWLSPGPLLRCQGESSVPLVLSKNIFSGQMLIGNYVTVTLRGHETFLRNHRKTPFCVLCYHGRRLRLLPQFNCTTECFPFSQVSVQSKRNPATCKTRGHVSAQLGYLIAKQVHWKVSQFKKNFFGVHGFFCPVEAGKIRSEDQPPEESQRGDCPPFYGQKWHVENCVADSLQRCSMKKHNKSVEVWQTTLTVWRHSTTTAIYDPMRRFRDNFLAVSAVWLNSSSWRCVQVFVAFKILNGESKTWIDPEVLFLHVDQETILDSGIWIDTAIDRINWSIYTSAYFRGRFNSVFQILRPNVLCVSSAERLFSFMYQKQQPELHLAKECGKSFPLHTAKHNCSTVLPKLMWCRLEMIQLRPTCQKLDSEKFNFSYNNNKADLRPLETRKITTFCTNRWWSGYLQQQPGS